MIMTFDDGLVASSRAAPLLDPSLIYAVNQGSSDAADAVDQSQAVQAFGHNVSLSSTFQEQDPWVQQIILNHMSPPAANALQSAGGKPKPKDDGGIFGSILHAVGSGLGAVEHTAGAVVGEAARDLGAPLRFTQHLIRAAHTIDTLGTLDSGSAWAGAWTHMFSPSDWADSWNKTENGERSFDQVAERDLRSKYGDTQVDFASRIVGGTKPEDVAKGLPEDQRVDFVERFRSPEFQGLMKELDASKISFGRDLVGRQLLVHSPTLPGGIPILGHKNLGQILSGGIDATTDIFIDPTLAGAKAVSAARAARFLVASEGGAETVDRLIQNNGQVQRLLKDVSGHLESGDVAGLIQRHPQLSEVAKDWAERGIKSQEELGDWFRTQAETGALFDGKVGGMVPKQFRGQGYGGVMPSMSMTDQAAISAKQKITQAIDWAAERPSAVETQRLVRGAGIEDPLNVSERLQRGVVEPIGDVLRRFTALAPDAREMDINDPRMLTMVQRYTRMGGMSTTDGNRLVNAFASAADEGGKRNIFKSTVLSSMRAMNVDEGYMRNWADLLDQGIVGRSYAPAGIDKLQLGGDTISAAVLENQLAHTVELPSYRAMLANANRTGFAKAAWGLANNGIVTGFMDKIWKPITLLRLGFPIRAGGEEAVSQMLRQGPGDFIRARTAAGAISIPGPDINRSALGWMADHLPESVRFKITDAADLAGARWSDTAGRALRGVEGAVAGEDMTKAAREVAEMFPGALPDEISAAHGLPGYLGTPETAVQMNRQGEKMKLVFQPTGGFREYTSTDPGQLTAWKYSLDQIAKDRLGREALGALDLERPEAVSKIADFLQSPTFSESWNRATRSKVLRDGSQVGTDATERGAAEDWASTVLDHAHALLHSGEGDRVIDPASLVEAGRGPQITSLAKITADMRPPSVGGPEVLPVAQNAWQSFLNHGFDRIVGRPMNWIARQPIFLQNYATARKDLEGLRSALEALAAPEGEEAALKVATQVDSHLKELATSRALNETIPYIHNPEVRSQFAVYTRNLMPFWFAQEQFVKRWASTFVHSPTAFREAQLAMNGLRHSGVVHKDENGNEVFTYPGVDLTADALSALTSWISGNKVRIPQPLTFNGQVKFATPGTERLGVPSFGPLVSIPLSAMADRFPELDKAQTQILGERGAGRGYLEQIVPTTATRVAKLFMANPDTDAQMASAQKQALQYFAAHGQIPDESADAMTKQKFLEDLRWTARTIAMLRTVYGFAAPASPEAVIDPDHITSEFRQLLGSGIPIADAVNELVKMHPHETVTPYTVFQSKSVSGAPIPATEATLKQFEDNRDFYATYPLAAAWLLPQKSQDPSFNMSAYRESIALGLRQRKAPDQMLNDIYYAMAAQDFFDSRRGKEDDLAAHKGPGAVRARAAINQSWSDFQQRYFDMHPVFADKYQSDAGHIERMRALDQLHAALADPRSPDVPHAGVMANLLANWDDLGDELSNYAGRRTTQAQNRRQRAIDGFTTWADQYVSDHPELEGVYNRLFRPELP